MDAGGPEGGKDGGWGRRRRGGGRTEEDGRPRDVEDGVDGEDVEGARVSKRLRAKGARAGETDEGVERRPHLRHKGEDWCCAEADGRWGRRCG